MIVLSLIACFLFWSAFQQNAEKYYKIGIWLLFLLTALRYPALGGTDNFSYVLTFQKVPLLDNLSGFESEFRIGYIYVNSILKTVFNDYIFFQIVYTALCVFFLDKAISLLDLNGKEKCLFLFGYFCFKFIWYFWGTLRQNLADVIFWYLIIYYYSKRNTFGKVKKIIIILTAVFVPQLFHSSATLNVVLVPFLIILREPKNIQTRICWVCLCSIILYIFSAGLFEILLSYAGLVDDRYDKLYSGEEAGDGNIVNYLFRLLFYVLFTLHYKKENYKYKNLVLNAFTIVILVGSVNHSLMLRVYEYYAFSMYISFAFILHYFAKDNRTFISVMYLLVMLILLNRFIIITDGGLMKSYYFFWQYPPLLPTEKIYGKIPF